MQKAIYKHIFVCYNWFIGGNDMEKIWKENQGVTKIAILEAKIVERLKLARVYQKLRNARKYLIHQISKEITEENDIIVAIKIKN